MVILIKCSRETKGRCRKLRIYAKDKRHACSMCGTRRYRLKSLENLFEPYLDSGVGGNQS